MTSFRHLLKLNKDELDQRGLRHTPFEIAQQPALWLEMLPDVLRFIDSAKTFLIQEQPTILAGAGTSAYAAQAVASTLRKQGWFRVEAIPSTELVLDPDGLFPREPFTLISLARSGNSPEGNAAFTFASELRQHTRHIVLTCNRHGELARLARKAGQRSACLYVLPEKANDRGLAMTSSFSGMVLAGQALAFADDPERFKQFVFQMAGAARWLIEHFSDAISALARDDFHRVVFVGAGNNYTTALECHLKLQELSGGRIVCKAETVLGIRHGPMSVIDDKTLVCAFLSHDPCVHQYELDLLRELQAKKLGLKTVAIRIDNWSDVGQPERYHELKRLVDVIIPMRVPAYGAAGVAGAADTAGSASTAGADVSDVSDEVAGTPGVYGGGHEAAPGACSASDGAPGAAGATIPPDHLWVAPSVIFGQILGLMASINLGLKPDAPSPGNVIHRVVQGVTIYPHHPV